MFLATYKATLKNLVRAALLWVIALLVVGVAIERTSSPNYGAVIVENNQIVAEYTDLDPEFEFDFHGYVQALRNNFAGLSIYAIPLFAVISVMLVLSRDYKDNFFEIDKAGGVRSGTYFLGRLAAILTVNIAVGLTINLFYNHLYCITRDIMGDLAMSSWSYICETNVRVLRLYFLGMLPGVIFYTGLTYMAGSLLKSGFLGSLIGSSWFMFLYAAMKNNISVKLTKTYQFLDPHAHEFYAYWGYYDTEWFTDKALRNPWSTEELILHTAIIAGAGIFGFVVSYFCVKKRTV